MLLALFKTLYKALKALFKAFRLPILLIPLFLLIPLIPLFLPIALMMMALPLMMALSALLALAQRR